MKLILRPSELKPALDAMELMKKKVLKGIASIAMARVRRLVANHYEDQQYAFRPPDTPERDAFEKERIVLAKKLAIKDDKNRPLMDKNGNYVIQNPADYNTAYNDLLDRHPKAKVQLEEHEKAVEAMMRQEITLEVTPVPFDLLPKEFEPEALGPLVDLIVDLPGSSAGDVAPEEDKKTVKKKK